LASRAALGYLYSPVSLNLIRPENARGVLAAGCLLGGVEDLCAFAYEACRQSIGVDTIDAWLAFSDAGRSTHGHGHGHGASDATPLSSSPATPMAELPQAVPVGASIFGLYAQRLRDDVFAFLVVQLPQALGVHPGADAEGRATLLRIFARVPFDLFKAAVESPTFHIGAFWTRVARRSSPDGG
jgi:hypothetical protein